jgi:hypothetical protein
MVWRKDRVLTVWNAGDKLLPNMSSQSTNLRRSRRLILSDHWEGWVFVLS